MSSNQSLIIHGKPPPAFINHRLFSILRNFDQLKTILYSFILIRSRQRRFHSQSHTINIYKQYKLTSLSLFPYWILKFGIALKIATSDCIVLLYTTGRYCLKSSDVKPLSWMILKRWKNKWIENWMDSLYYSWKYLYSTRGFWIFQEECHLYKAITLYSPRYTTQTCGNMVTICFTPNVIVCIFNS